MEVNEEGPDTEGGGDMQDVEGEQELDRVQVQQERKEESRYSIKTLQVFEFGSLQEAMYVERRQSPDHDDENEFVRWRVVARDLKPRDDLFAVMLRWKQRRHSSHSWQECARSGESKDLRR